MQTSALSKTPFRWVQTVRPGKSSTLVRAKRRYLPLRLLLLQTTRQPNTQLTKAPITTATRNITTAPGQLRLWHDIVTTGISTSRTPLRSPHHPYLNLFQPHSGLLPPKHPTTHIIPTPRRERHALSSPNNRSPSTIHKHRLHSRELLTFIPGHSTLHSTPTVLRPSFHRTGSSTPRDPADRRTGKHQHLAHHKTATRVPHSVETDVGFGRSGWRMYTREP